MINVIACDDGRVEKLGSPKRLFTIIACVLFEDLIPIDLKIGKTRIDGLDSSSIISALAIDLRRKHREHILLLDTIIYAGFNIVSIKLVKMITGMDVIAFYPYKPNLQRLVSTVEKHLDHADLRIKLLRQLKNLITVKTDKGEAYVITTLDDYDYLHTIIERYQLHTTHLEPLRTAHLVASNMSQFLPVKQV